MSFSKPKMPAPPPPPKPQEAPKAPIRSPNVSDVQVSSKTTARDRRSKIKGRKSLRLQQGARSNKRGGGRRSMLGKSRMGVPAQSQEGNSGRLGIVR